MGDDLGNNLLKPGDTPHENAQFLVFLAAVIQAVARHADLLRVAIATPANDHRLGANEAPPAIISIFLGDMLQDIVGPDREGGRQEHHCCSAARCSRSASTVLPTLPRDAGDRKPHQPVRLSLTGNKFEFRRRLEPVDRRPASSS